MGCSSCGSSSSSCGCSSSSGCGGDCGQPKVIVTKQGLPGAPGDPGSYYFEITQTIDFLDTFVIDNPNANQAISMGSIVLAASVAGQSKSYEIGTPVKISSVTDRGNAGAVTVPTAKIEGVVASYNILTGDLSIDVLGVSGTGTHAAWDVDLNWHISTARYLNGITLPPTGAGSSHGGIIIPGNTIFATEHVVKININGTAGVSANAMEVLYDGAICFSQVNTVGSDFQMEILITLGHYVTISTKLTTTVGTDDTIQFLGMNNPTYLLSTYKPNFKTDKIITFTDYSSQPFVLYSGIGVRL